MAMHASLVDEFERKPSIHSQSVHSLTENSEAINETEEINEVKVLRYQGDQAFDLQDYASAIQFYTEALQIDERNVEIIGCRAAAYVEQSKYVEAHKDASLMLSIDDNYPQGHYLMGVTLNSLGQQQEAIQSFLSALSLDRAQEVMFANSVVGVVGSMGKLKKSTIKKLYNMDPYKKLTEAGVYLYQVKRYELAVKVLKGALELETNQKGITMKLQLTMANSHTALRQYDSAITLFQDCLANAVAAHDYQYQTKALVSIASLFLDSGNTYQAIVYYEKLMQLKVELEGGKDRKEALPDYWTLELQCGLHLNLSIAYKTIGNMREAEKHARCYLDMVVDGDSAVEKAESCCNVGLLNEIIGKYETALEFLLKYREISKANGLKTHLAQSYGCLGSVYGHLHNWKLAMTYHEQHINMMQKLSNSKLLAVAYEQQGDTFMLKKDFESAIKSFQLAVPLLRKEGAKRANALCKLGTAYMNASRQQYALYHFEQAAMIAEDLDLKAVLEMCEFNLATILQTSTQLLELEKSLKYFQRLIPILEQRAVDLLEENAFFPKDLERRLQGCYVGIQSVLSKLGNKEECLQYAECSHKHCLARFKTLQEFNANWTKSSRGVLTWWQLDRINYAVNSQSATVLYYSVLPHEVLIWALKPGAGMRFYVGKAPSGCTMNEHLLNLCEQLATSTVNKFSYQSENRALPRRNVHLEILQVHNAAKSFVKKIEDSMKTESGDVPQKQTSDVSIEKSSSSQIGDKNKSVQKVLYNLLVSPMEDVLSDLAQGSPLVIIPDKELFSLPFGLLRDWKGQLIKDRFRVTIIPSLYVLEKLAKHELDQLRVIDDLEYERAQTRLGGLTRMLGHHSRMKAPHDLSSYQMTLSEKSNSSVGEVINPRQISNPRFYKSGRMSNMARVKPPFMPEGTFVSLTSKMNNKSRQTTQASIALPPTPSDVKRFAQSWPVPPPTGQSGPCMERLLGAENMSTIVTKTATDTDIVSSTSGVTEYKQIPNPDRVIVFGNPKLCESMMMFGKEWKPPSDLVFAQKEAFKVAEIADARVVVGNEATKEVFLKEIQTASIIHVACYANLEEGYIALSPNKVRQEDGPPEESSYIVTIDDILPLKLSAKLVVLSCGWSTYNARQLDQGSLLPSAFLIAGAVSVLTVLWTTPNSVVDKFFTHFYLALRNNVHVTHAVNEAQTILQEDERFSSPSYWAPFVLVGSDVIIDAKQVKTAQLHQQINKVEQEVQDMSIKDLLNPKPFTEPIVAKEENLKTLQGILGKLIVNHKKHPEVITELIKLTTTTLILRPETLVDSNLKHLHSNDAPMLGNTLSDCLHENGVAIELLHFLGYHFEAQGVSTANPYIMYPHWDIDNLLLPTLESLMALLELAQSPACVQAVYEFLPASQELLCHLIDMLSITKHAAEIQLKTNDLSVSQLWHRATSQQLLLALGFHQIGVLLTFNNTPANRKLLNASLQLFLSVSSLKSNTLMHKLDVKLLGLPSVSDLTNDNFCGGKHLPSLSPVMLPRYQLKMSAPWSTCIENEQEMRGKMTLARSKSDLTNEYRRHSNKAKSWHQKLVEAQGNKRLQEVGRPKVKVTKVKVQSGTPISQARIPVDFKRQLTILETGQRRDYDNYVFNQRLKTIGARHREEVKKLYMPFVQDT